MYRLPHIGTACTTHFVQHHTSKNATSCTDACSSLPRLSFFSLLPRSTLGPLAFGLLSSSDLWRFPSVPVDSGVGLGVTGTSAGARVYFGRWETGFGCGCSFSWRLRYLSSVATGVALGVDVDVGFEESEAVGVVVGAKVGVVVGVSVGVTMGVVVGVSIGVSVGVVDGAIVGVSDAADEFELKLKLEL